MANVIDAIINLVKDPKLELLKYSKSHNRANSMGEGLEEYVKDLFAGTVNEKDKDIRNLRFSETFSYEGNQNNPPDAMLKGGDAIEMKKLESKDAGLALNSSYPKAKIDRDSPMISKSCKICEDWTVKDMIYAVGVVKGDNLKSLAFIYGSEYCAEKETYEKIKNKIKDGVESIPGVEFAGTKELGRVNRVDPLGITYLRIRGMWGIENPFKVFDYVYVRDEQKDFNFVAIINSEKYLSFDNHTTLEGMLVQYSSLNIKDGKVKNPNNPAQLIDVKVISFSV